MFGRFESTGLEARIQGNVKIRVFNELQAQRIPLRLSVIGRGYERLTIVTGMESEGGKTYLLLDRPLGFEEDVPGSVGESVLLEFTDRDRIPHSCRTVLAEPTEENLRLVMPAFLKRSQRRRHFRVEPPQGTRMVFLINGRELESPVLNISMSGSLLVGPRKGSPESSFLYVDATISGIDLIARHDDLSLFLKIKTAEIRRVEFDEKLNRMKYAIQFRELEPPNEKELEKFIFSCQRRLLRKRSGLVAE